MGGIIIKEYDDIFEPMIRFNWEKLQVGVYKFKGFGSPL
jgi:hypothetical protein